MSTPHLSSQAQQAASPLLSPDTVLTSILEQEASGGLEEEDDEDQEAEASQVTREAESPQPPQTSPPAPAVAPRPQQQHNPAALASHVLQPRLDAHSALVLPAQQQYSRTAFDALAAAAASVSAAEAAGRLLRFSRGGGSSASTPRSSFDLNPLRRISSEGGKMHSLSAHPAYACSTSESGVCLETVRAVAEALSVPLRPEHHAAAAAEEGEAMRIAEDSASDTSSQLVLHRLVAGAHMIPHVDKVKCGTGGREGR